MHQIRFVDDSALPEGHDCMLVQHGEGMTIFYKRSAVNADVLEDSWAAYRALLATPPPKARLRCVV